MTHVLEVVVRHRRDDRFSNLEGMLRCVFIVFIVVVAVSGGGGGLDIGRVCRGEAAQRSVSTLHVSCALAAGLIRCFGSRTSPGTIDGEM